MIIKVRYRVVFNRTGKLDSSGKAGVLIECYQYRVRRYESTGIRISPKEWDKQKSEVKKRPDLNRLIRDNINELEQFELTFSANYGRAFRLADFDLKDSVAPQKEELITFTDFAIKRINLDHAKNKINKTTKNRYERVINLLAESLDVRTVKFSDLTYANIEVFDDFLTIDQDQQRNTAYKHHQVIGKYLTKAIKRKIFPIQDNPYNDFENKQIAVETVVLAPAEIEKIERLTFISANKHLEFYRDSFLLAFYTLLRIGDITQLRNQNLIETDDGLVLDMAAQKTKKINRLKVFAMHPTPDGPSKPEQILRKYWRTDNSRFFERSHPKMNEYVKEIMKLASIKKHVTFHTSRHSGITYLVTIMPTTIVQKLAQHKSIVTTMRYVHIAQQDVYQALDRTNWNQHGESSKTKI
ncbi:site-specific integrase [Spirosoma flavum]|uniref:Site-specific integrase n=1 Tax=Spirosoma flavum TaxID=2048557 RepID=A0ABW6ANU7_9BACT